MALLDDLTLVITAQTQEVLRGLDQVVARLDRFEGSVQRAGRSTDQLSRKSIGMGKGLLGLATKFAAVVGGVQLLNKGFQNASFKEQSQVQFGTLLGSAQAAEDRIKELSKVANSTPFSNAQVISMSKTLQAMTGGALASEKGIKLVGDTAAALNPQELQRFTMHIGRMYGQIQSGQAFGESLKELSEMGAISGTTANQLRQLTKEGKINADTWAIVEKELLKNEGAMENLSKTGGGALSTLLGTWNDTLADAFMPLIKQFTPVMQDLTALVEKMRPAMVAAGEAMASVIGRVHGVVRGIITLFQNGDLGKATALGLQLGGALFINWFFGLLTAGYQLLTNTVFNAFETMASAEFWSGALAGFGGLLMIISGAVAVLTGGFMNAVSSWSSLLIAGVLTGVALLGAGMTMASAAFAIAIIEALEKMVSVGQKLGFPGMDEAAAALGDTKGKMKAASAAAKEVLTKPKQTFEQLREQVKDNMTKTGDALISTGKDMFTAGLDEGKKGVKGMADAAKEPFADTLEGVELKPADIIDTDGMQKEWDALTNGLFAPVEAEAIDIKEKTEDNAAEAGDAIKGAVDPDPIADSLTKIGGGGNVFVAAREASEAGAGGGVAGAGGGGISAIAAGSSSGLGPGASLGGTDGIGVLQSIDSRMAEVVRLLSSGNPTGGGSGLTVSIL